MAAILQISFLHAGNHMIPVVKIKDVGVEDKRDDIIGFVLVTDAVITAQEPFGYDRVSVQESAEMGDG